MYLASNDHLTIFVVVVIVIAFCCFFCLVLFCKRLLFSLRGNKRRRCAVYVLFCGCVLLLTMFVCLFWFSFLFILKAKSNMFQNFYVLSPDPLYVRAGPAVPQWAVPSPASLHSSGVFLLPSSPFLSEAQILALEIYGHTAGEIKVFVSVLYILKFLEYFICFFTLRKSLKLRF